VFISIQERPAMPQKHPRKQLFVDPKVQGTLLARAVIYWLSCIATITLMILAWRIVTGPARVFYTHFDDMWFHFGPALVAALLLLPLALVDIVRVSNRFAGPLYRVRGAMRRLTQGLPVEPIHFRDNDFWQELATEFNALAERVSKLEREAAGRAEDDEPVLTASGR
jgi:hypothetical protein